MTRLAKLYAAVLANPNTGIAFRDFERLLRGFGFAQVRTTGSHRHFVHPDVPEILTVQPRGKDAKTYQVRLFLDMIEQYGLKGVD